MQQQNEQARIGEFPFHEGDLLEFDFDFDVNDFLDEALAVQDVVMEEPISELQHDAIGTLAAQASGISGRQSGLGGRQSLLHMLPSVTSSHFGTQPDMQRWDFIHQDAAAAAHMQPAQPTNSEFVAHSMPEERLQSSSPGQAPHLEHGSHHGSSLDTPSAEAEGSSAILAPEGSSGLGGSGGSETNQLPPPGLGAQPMTEAELRAERTKAKNKRAQKKFRQKQKDKQEELERSTSELSARLKSLQAELEVLKEQRRILQQQALQQGSAAVIDGSIPESLGETVYVPSKGCGGLQARSGILLDVLVDPPRTLTYDQASRLSLKDHARICKETGRQVNELLRDGAEDESSPSGIRLRALLNERHGLIAWTSINNPVIMHKLMTSKLGDEPVPDTQPPSPEFWRRILEILQLGEQQSRNLLAARRTYLTKVGALLQQRRRLRDVMRALDIDGLADNIIGSSARHVAWSEAAAELQEIVDAFHVSHCAFMVSVHNRITGFTALQEALLLVHTLPHAQDVFALIKELAAGAGEPTAEELLKAGAQQPHTRPETSDGVPLQLEERMEKAISTLELDGFIEKLR